MPNYGDPHYWDKRYKEAGDSASFDWLESYFSLHSLLAEFIPDKSMRILVLGCGNAEFSEDLYDDGYTNVVNVDISSVVIRQMQERNAQDRPLMGWKVMDITNMSEFESNSFDIAIDKSTIDALLCGDQSFLKVALMLKETQRVLKTGASYFAISYGKPEQRSFHFLQPFLSFELREFILYDSACQTDEEKTEKSHYIYVCEKLPDADEMSARHFENCFEQLMLNAEAEKLLYEQEDDFYGDEYAENVAPAEQLPLTTRMQNEEVKQEESDQEQDINREADDDDKITHSEQAQDSSASPQALAQSASSLQQQEAENDAKIAAK